MEKLKNGKMALTSEFLRAESSYYLFITHKNLAITDMYIATEKKVGKLVGSQQKSRPIQSELIVLVQQHVTASN